MPLVFPSHTIMRNKGIVSIKIHIVVKCYYKKSYIALLKRFAQTFWANFLGMALSDYKT